MGCGVCACSVTRGRVGRVGSFLGYSIYYNIQRSDARWYYIPWASETAENLYPLVCAGSIHFSCCRDTHLSRTTRDPVLVFTNFSLARYCSWETTTPDGIRFGFYPPSPASGCCQACTAALRREALFRTGTRLSTYRAKTEPRACRDRVSECEMV